MSNSPEPKPFLTEEEWEELVEKANRAICPTCEHEFSRSGGFLGPLEQYKGILYCSEKCVKKAEVKHAIRTQVQPTDFVTIDGWDL